MSSIILKTLKPQNIKKGVEILHTTGTFEGGTSINNEDITVNSSTVEQEFEASTGYTGLGVVTVNPYVLDTKTVDSSTVSQTVTSDEDGLSSVTVNPYTLDTKTVDSSTVSQTVNSSADGLSSVTVNPYTLDSKTVDPSTSALTVNSSADGLSSVTLNAVTSSIDSNISAGNIKSGVTILGVAGTLSSNSDWILDAKGGATTLDTDTDGLSDTNYGMYELLQNTALTSVTLRNTTATGNYTFYKMLIGSNYLQNVSFPNLTTITGTQTLYQMCSGLSNVVLSFPELKTINGNECFAQVRYGVSGFYPSFPKLESVKGTTSFGNFFEDAPAPSSNLVPYELPELKELDGTECMVNFCLSGRGGCSSLSLPKLESIKGYYNLQGCFASNNNCRTLSMPRLLYCEGSGQQFRWMWQSVYSSPGNTITTTPEFFKYSGSYMYSIQSYLGTINLVIPQDYTYLNGWNYTGGTTYLIFDSNVVNSQDLTDANILDILQKLGSVSDYDQVTYTVVFDGRTILDNANYDYTTAYDKLVNAGWTITNLTITAPQLIEITSGSSLNLKNEDTITFNALYGWTASVNDPSIGLSAYSGNAGNNQSITVTMDPNWEGSAIVTFTCSNGTLTQTKTVTVMYSNTAYTRLQWAAIGNSESQYCDTGVILNSSSRMQLSFMPKGYGGSTVTTTGLDGYNTEWRTFGHNSGMYFDLAGGYSDSRLIASGWYTIDASCNYEFGKYYIKNLDNQTVVTGSPNNTFVSTGTDTMKIGIGTNGNHIFELKFYVDGTNLSHDFVPAMDNNNVVGYYDMINDNFITPNTGTITGGPVYQ